MVTFLGRAGLAEFLFAGAFFTSYVTARRILPTESPWLRWVGVVTSGAVLWTVEFHLLRAIGAFDLFGAAVLQTLLTVAAWRLSGGNLWRWWTRDLRFAGNVSRLCRRSPYRASIAVFMALAVPIVVRPLILPPMGWDSLTYHAVKAAMWVQHGGRLPMEGPGTWAYYPLLWSGGEIFTSWAMLPFHSDLLATAVDAAAWLALGLALIALARGLGIREPHASAAAVFVLAIPTLRISVGSGYVEIILIMMAVCTWALAVRFIQQGPLGAFYLSMGGAGVAAGVKFPFLPLSLLTVVALGLRLAMHPIPLRSRVAHLAAGASLFALILLPWPWAAYQRTGLPLSPLPVKVLGQPLGNAPPEVKWYMLRPISGSVSGAESGLLARTLLEERMGPGATTMVAVAISLAAWPFLWRRHAAAVLLLGATIAATWAEYFTPEFSVLRRYFSTSAVRFLLPALVPAVILSAGFCRARQPLGRAYFLFLLAGACFQFLIYVPYGLSSIGVRALLIVLFALGAVILAVAHFFRHITQPGWRVGIVAAVVALALLGLTGLRDAVRYDLLRKEFAIHPIHHYWIGAASLVDTPPTPHRIAVTSGPWQDLDNWLVYPFLGRALQNDVLYVPISLDGVVRHFGNGGRNAEYAHSSNFASWEARLRKSGVTEIMSFRPASIELGWMESHPLEFRRLAGERGDWGLFAFRERSLR